MGYSSTRGLCYPCGYTFYKKLGHKLSSSSRYFLLELHKKWSVHHGSWTSSSQFSGCGWLRLRGLSIEIYVLLVVLFRSGYPDHLKLE
ncbi:hypothetical protein IGI04_026461 [Brassica rapa subsp. trilocularis]|uniref:Uncharacterized protein n=1 Tax=Brassica rapa subsp. trilocularis TaxID=1813537 RepID=A0ABQ7KWE1_BRACM|nr:hypothetical protein IGI04_026461 [Brassica rapa subsp. trilocularis]